MNSLYFTEFKSFEIIHFYSVIDNYLFSYRPDFYNSNANRLFFDTSRQSFRFYRVLPCQIKKKSIL